MGQFATEPREQHDQDQGDSALDQHELGDGDVSQAKGRPRLFFVEIAKLAKVQGMKKKEWGDEISWDEVMVRWKGRGPMNETYVAKLQKGYRG